MTMFNQAKHVCMLPQDPKCMSVAPSASTWRHVVCFLRSLMLPAGWHHNTNLFLRSRLSLAAERKRQMTSSHFCTIHPYSAVCFGKDTFFLVIQTANLFYMPFLVFYDCTPRYNVFILFCDFLALLDVVGTFFTGFIDKHQKLVVFSTNEIVMHYLKDGFLIDFIGMLPLQTIELFEDCRIPSSTIMFVLKLLRLRALKHKWHNLHRQIGLSHFTTVIVSVFANFGLFIHWMTYVYYQVPAFLSHYHDDDWIGNVWLTHNKVTTDHSVDVKYTTSFYAVCGLCIGAGYLNTITEHIKEALILDTFVTLIGLVYVGYNFLALLRIAIYKTYQKCLHEGRLKELEEYMVYKRLPQYLQRNVKLFIKYKYDRYYFNEELILATINEKIKNDINMYCCEKLVKNVRMFRELPTPLLNSFTFNLEHFLFMPGEILTKVGAPAESMYLIASGTVAVISDTGRLLTHYKDGTNFGEEVLLNPGTKRNATFIALEVTEVYKLHYTKFLLCLQPYPHMRRKIEDTVKTRKETHRDESAN